jgi:hypothetical protein
MTAREKAKVNVHSKSQVFSYSQSFDFVNSERMKL